MKGEGRTQIEIERSKLIFYKNHTYTRLDLFL